MWWWTLKGLARRVMREWRKGRASFDGVEVVKYYAQKLRRRKLWLWSLEVCISAIEEHLPQAREQTHRDVIKLRPVLARCLVCGASMDPRRLVCTLCPVPRPRLKLRRGPKAVWQKELRTRLSFARSMRDDPPLHRHRVSHKSRMEKIYGKGDKAE